MNLRVRPALLRLALGAALTWMLLTPGSAQNRTSTPAQPGEFHFARMIYTDMAGRLAVAAAGGNRTGPRAEMHLLQSVPRLTRVNIGDPVSVRLTEMPCSTCLALCDTGRLLGPE